MEAAITVVIKSANQSVPDHRVDCDSTWSVSQLKHHLSNSYPSKPKPEEQRLIYSGQLLSDDLHLCSALRHPSENNAYTVHLVCSPRVGAVHGLTVRQAAYVERVSVLSGQPPAAIIDAMLSQPPVYGSAADAAAAAVPTPEPADSRPPPLIETTEGLRRRHLAGPPGGLTETSASSSQGVDASATTHPSTTQMPFVMTGDPMHQLHAMQQVYAQYMASYMQYMQMGQGLMPHELIQSQVPSHSGVAAGTAAAGAEPQHDFIAAQQPPAQPQNGGPLRMNAQGGEADDDDDDEGFARDWLDWMYVASRMFVLLFIVYFYSSISRFMLVIGFSMMVYLYQAGWFRPARRVEPPVTPTVAPVNNNVDDRNNNLPHRREEEGQEPAAAPLPEPQAFVAPPPPPQPSILALLFTFVTTFFTSLVPEQPQLV